MERIVPYDIAQARLNLLTMFDLCEFYVPFLTGTGPEAQRRWSMLDRERREWMASFGEAPASVEKPHRRDGPQGG